MKRYRTVKDQIREIKLLLGMIKDGKRASRPKNTFTLSGSRMNTLMLSDLRKTSHIHEAMGRYISARLVADPNEARAGLADYLDCMRTILNAIWHDDSINRASEIICTDFRGAIDSIGTQDQDPLFSPIAKPGAPRLSPLRIQHLAQISAAITHATEFPYKMKREASCKLIVDQLAAEQKKKLRPDKPGSARSGGPMWGYIMKERNRILNGARGPEARLKHDYYLAIIPEVIEIPVDYSPYLQLGYRLEKPCDLDAMLKFLRSLRPKPKLVKK